MKKIFLMVCILALLFMTSGCQKTDDADSSNSSLVGKVISIDGTTVTLQLGELSEAEMKKPEEGQSDGSTGKTPPERPEEGQSDASSGQGGENSAETPPERPEEGQSDASSGQGGENSAETPPERPEEEQSDDSSAETPPERPEEGQSDGNSGETSSEMPKDQSAGSMMTFTAGEETDVFDLAGASITVEKMEGSEEGSISDITEDAVLELTFGDHNAVTAVTVKKIPGMQQPGGGFGGSSEVTQGTSENTIETDGVYAGTGYTSDGDDENALRITGATVTLDSVEVNKQSGATSNTEDGDFYGMNAALLVTDGANATIKESAVHSSAQNGNGVFSYGEGTVVNISDSVIQTTADNSGGIQTTGGGTMNASNLEITTEGNSSAAIRSDRGGGTVNVDGGTYTSRGYNSPAIYSTAAIAVKNADLVAEHSEALVIEGKNSISLEDCDVSGNMSDTEGSSSEINVHNVMIYQSMSGDADVGTSEFSMKGGSLTSNNGDMFFVTNTHCILNLSGVELSTRETDGYFLLVSGNDASRGWGSAGNNGAQVEFTADAQTIEGDIAVDTISTLSMTLTGGSVWNGSLNIVDNEQGGTAIDGNAVVTVDEGCTWNLTGDCTITSLTNNGTIHFNGYTITLADGTVL